MTSGIRRQLRVVGSEYEQPWLRIAFATDDGERVNQHFGTAHSFAIYGVNPEAHRLLEVAEFEESDVADEETDPSEENQVTDYSRHKLKDKLTMLDGCIAVYCRACGASAVKKLLERHIQPLKVVDDTSIKNLIKAFQLELSEGPSNWLAKAIQRQGNEAFYAVENGFVSDISDN